MYRHGEGVARDYQTAIFWQQKLTALLQASFEQEPSAQKGELLLAELWELGDYNMERKQREEAKAAFEQMLDLSRRLNDEAFQSRDSIRYFAVASSQLALLYMEDGQYEEVAKELETIDSRRNAAEVRSMLGKVCYAQGKASRGKNDEAGAEVLFRQAANYLRRAHKTLQTAALKKILVNALVFVGDGCGDTGRIEDARECYAESLSLCQELRKQWPEGTDEAEIRELHIGVCLRLVDSLRALNRQEEGMAAANEGVGEALAFYQEQPNFRNRCNLAMAYAKYGQVCYDVERIEEAKLLFTEEVRYRQENAQEGCSYPYYNLYCDSLERLGEACAELEQWGEAVTHFGASLRLRQAIYKAENGRTPYKKSYAHTCSRLADAARQMGDVGNARGLYNAELTLREELLEEEGKTLANLDALATACYRLGTVDPDRQDSELVKQAFLIWYSLHKADPENEQITRKVEFIKRLLL